MMKDDECGEAEERSIGERGGIVMGGVMAVDTFVSIKAILLLEVSIKTAVHSSSCQNPSLNNTFSSSRRI